MSLQAVWQLSMELMAMHQVNGNSQILTPFPTESKPLNLLQKFGMVD